MCCVYPPSPGCPDTSPLHLQTRPRPEDILLTLQFQGQLPANTQKMVGWVLCMYKYICIDNVFVYTCTYYIPMKYQIYIYMFMIIYVYTYIYIRYISVYECMRLLGMGRVFLGEVCAFTCTSCFFPGDLAEMPAQIGCRMEDSFLWRALRDLGGRSCPIRVQ